MWDVFDVSLDRDLAIARSPRCHSGLGESDSASTLAEILNAWNDSYDPVVLVSTEDSNSCLLKQAEFTTCLVVTLCRTCECCDRRIASNFVVVRPRLDIHSLVSFQLHTHTTKQVCFLFSSALKTSVGILLIQGEDCLNLLSSMPVGCYEVFKVSVGVSDQMCFWFK